MLNTNELINETTQELMNDTAVEVAEELATNANVWEVVGKACAGVAVVYGLYKGSKFVITKIKARKAAKAEDTADEVITEEDVEVEEAEV